MENTESLYKETDILEYLILECNQKSQKIALLLAKGPRIKSTHCHSTSASLANCNEVFKKELNEGQWREKTQKEKSSLLDQLKRIDDEIQAAKNKYNSFSTELTRINKEIKEVISSISEKNDFIKVLEESHHSQLYGKVNRTTDYN